MGFFLVSESTNFIILYFFDIVFGKRYDVGGDIIILPVVMNSFCFLPEFFFSERIFYFFLVIFFGRRLHCGKVIILLFWWKLSRLSAWVFYSRKVLISLCCYFFGYCFCHISAGWRGDIILLFLGIAMESWISFYRRYILILMVGRWYHFIIFGESNGVMGEFSLSGSIDFIIFEYCFLEIHFDGGRWYHFFILGLLIVMKTFLDGF